MHKLAVVFKPPSFFTFISSYFIHMHWVSLPYSCQVQVFINVMLFSLRCTKFEKKASTSIISYKGRVARITQASCDTAVFIQHVYMYKHHSLNRTPFCGSIAESKANNNTSRLVSISTILLFVTGASE